MRSGRRPSPEGIRLLFAGTISPWYVQVGDEPKQKDDTTRPDGKQEKEKKRKEEGIDTKLEKTKTEN